MTADVRGARTGPTTARPSSKGLTGTIENTVILMVLPMDSGG